MVTGLIILALMVVGFFGGYFLGGAIGSRLFEGGTKAGRLIAAAIFGAAGAVGGAAVGDSVTDESTEVVEPAPDSHEEVIVDCSDQQYVYTERPSGGISVGAAQCTADPSGTECYNYEHRWYAKNCEELVACYLSRDPNKEIWAVTVKELVEMDEYTVFYWGGKDRYNWHWAIPTDELEDKCQWVVDSYQ